MYTGDMPFAEWVAQAGSKGSSLISTIEQGKLLYDKFQHMRGTLTDAQIAALPQFEGRTEADITALAGALYVFQNAWELLNSVAVGAGDRIAYLSPVL